MSSRALDRLLSRTTAPRRRFGPAGGLTSGPPLPAAEIHPGVWDFRTPILVLALQPIVDPEQFAVILGDNFARLGAPLLSCGISVGEPFWQALPGDNTMLAAGLQTLGVASAVSAIDTSVGAGTAAVGLASIFGWGIGPARATSPEPTA